MMIGLDSKVGCTPDDVRVVCRRKLQREHFDVADCHLWGEARSYRRHFAQPLHGLQDLQPPTYDQLGEGWALSASDSRAGSSSNHFRTTLASMTTITVDYWSCPAYFVIGYGRLLRALLNWRNSRSCLI